MVRSAAALIAREGLRATGMREVADHARAPRGSIRHYFPGGKDQLTLEALTWMGAEVHDELERVARVPVAPDAATREHGPPSRAVAVLQTFVGMWRQSLADSGIDAGCSIAAVVHDTDDPDLLACAERVFTSWQEPFRHALLADGVPAPVAESLATAVLAALEGAVILCRARRDLAPLDRTGSVLVDLLRSAGRA